MCASQQAKGFGGMLDVVFCKALHEEVGVVVVVLVSDRRAANARFLDGFFKVFREKLAFFIEWVAEAHINQAGKMTLPALDELRGVVLLPLVLVVAEVAGKGLGAPGAAAGVGDGRKGADRLVLAGVLEEEGEGAVAAHGVAGDGDARGVELGKGGEDVGGQLARDVRLHLVVGVVRRPDRVNVEGGGAAKVPGVVLAGQVEPARRRVRVQQGEAERRGVGLQEALVGHVVGRAGQAGEVEEHGRGGGGGGGGGDEEVEVHGRAGCGRLVGELEQAPAKDADGGVCCEGHGERFGVCDCWLFLCWCSCM